MNLYEGNSKLADEWDYEKNGELTPKMVALHSNKKVWWKCGKGHSWQAYINNRSKGYGCPYCMNQKILVGYNDLGTVRPDLASQWDYEKNEEITPQNVMANNATKVWWKCDKGHSWQATIKDRNNGNGCPYCANQKVLEGYNDLQTTNPELAKEWDFTKNEQLTPKMVTAGSKKKVWWKCNKGHLWQTAISERKQGVGCPYCANKKIISGYNDLQTTNPEMLKEWDFEKNKLLTPKMVTAGSKKKVWWKCNKGHSWQDSVANRKIGYGCRICSGKKVQVGFNEKCNI